MAFWERLLVGEIRGRGPGSKGNPRPVVMDINYGGLSTVPPNTMMSSFRGGPFPPQYHTYWNDFDTYVAGDWTVTSTGTTPTRALTSVDGGNLLLTISAADNDNTFLQTIKENWTFTAGKQLFFEARLKVSDATQTDWIMGLQITDTTPLAVSDGVWFQKPDDAATVDFHVASASAQTDATAIATQVADTFNRYQFYYDGVDKIFYGIDDVILGSTVVTNIPLSTRTLCVSFGLQNGEAVAKTMTLDYIFVAKARL